MTTDDFDAVPVHDEELGSNGAQPFRQPTATTVVRALPHSLEAEEGLISSILVDPVEGLTRCSSSNLSIASFYDPKLGILYGLMQKMHEAAKPIDPATLAEQLKASRQLDQIGGYAFLAQVSRIESTSAQIPFFIQKVREYAQLRDLIRESTRIVEECYQTAPDIGELAAGLIRRTTAIAQGNRPRGAWPAPISAAALIHHPPPTPPVLIDGILYAGGTMLVAGPSKSMKTFSLMDQALAISTGGLWLGFQCVEAPVLYLNLELQDFASSHRLAAICHARGIKPPANFHMLNLRGVRVSIEELSVRLNPLIERFGIRYVAIDPHYKVSSVSGMEENSNDDQGRLLNALECITTSANAALAISHHFAKGDASAKNAIDRASGGGVFARWGDVMMTFTPHEEDECMTVEMSLRNFAPVSPFVVRWNYPRWSCDGQLDPASLKRHKPGTFKEKFSADSILTALGDQLLSSSEWEKASGASPATFHRKRKELLNSKKVTCTMGCYRKT